jgi:hypothetical protein
MLNTRIGLIAAGLVFGVWEAVDIFRIEVPAVAAVFAALFLGGTLWFWRRDSVRAATGLLVLFVFEAAVAPSLKHISTATRVSDMALGVVGAVLAASVIVRRVVQTRRVPA